MTMLEVYLCPKRSHLSNLALPSAGISSFSIFTPKDLSADLKFMASLEGPPLIAQTSPCHWAMSILNFCADLSE